MRFTVFSPVLPLLASGAAAETILGAYIFHRHGDRTAKALAPTNLTTLGYEQVYTSGQYFRSRYLQGANRIRDINRDRVKLTQLDVTSPVDNVLQSSAMGFLQGLYPPTQHVQVLASGESVQAPMGGYQLIPVNTISTGAGSEDAGWLQQTTSCHNAKVSSNSYFDSPEYASLASSTSGFYSSLVPVVNRTLNKKDVTFKNAYVVYDLINVASIHNSSIPSSRILTPETLFQARTLADTHEWNLAYNASDKARAVAGMQLAGEILKSLNSSIAAGASGDDANKLGIQFGAYATMLSFFGLAGLDQASGDFRGVPDYASSLVFELFTQADVAEGGFPATKDLQVRFLFHNGTSSNSSAPTVYPLFGGLQESVSWTDFSRKLGRLAIGTTAQWCKVCGSSTPGCAAKESNGNGSANANGGGAKESSEAHGGMSAAVGGVIGAMVTLAVLLGALGAAMWLGGFRMVRRAAVGEGSVEGSEVAGKP